jgi:hypothetical protein
MYGFLKKDIVGFFISFEEELFSLFSIIIFLRNPIIILKFSM